jgi:hypothetical protein
MVVNGTLIPQNEFICALSIEFPRVVMLTNVTAVSTSSPISVSQLLILVLVNFYCGSLTCEYQHMHNFNVIG